MKKPCVIAAKYPAEADSTLVARVGPNAQYSTGEAGEPK
jgi:hypothetical protein